jgi:predicted KAP-like P-loop ATPase
MWPDNETDRWQRKKEKLSRRRPFIFVGFNAWLYQGYDDAGAALMEVIRREADKGSREATKGHRES